ncbi:hypothetical protein NLI96_g10492 [Meripilus lineatus]|uniref:DUF6533 domain-containing protein n=1 Tax=Meripilus lineatus TaxID=2056292 RepID=A0AAD5UV09_9APHY|nr:hypothetical protein NLI96_g10492 [Physisporinus lineatus]
MTVPIDQIYLNNYLFLLGGIVFYYDWLLTLSEEIQFVWLAPRTGGFWIFLLNRYFTFFAYLAVLAPQFVPFHEINACKSFVLYYKMSSMVEEAIIGGAYTHPYLN